MIRIKSVFLKLFITYILIILASHLVLGATYYLLIQNHLFDLHLNANPHEYHGLVLGVASFISIVVTALFAYYLSKRITTPVREMNRAAMYIAEGKFDQRVHINSHDELAALSETFNEMAEALSSLDQMRKEFVANVSHDLRSPLTSIHGYIAAFLDDTIPSEQQTHYLTVMKEQSERMIRLVNDLLDVARIEAGQLDIEPVNFNLSEFVRRIIARMEPEFVQKHVKVELHCPDRSDIYVVADPERIDQVIVNLVQNAVQFSAPDHAVEIHLNAEKQGRAMISVRDTGPGMTQEELKFIWERFYKAEKARTTQSGTGLGLSIVKRLLDLHHSPIHVMSEVGMGSTFTFSLPLAPSHR